MSKIIFLITSVFYLGLCFGQANGKAYYIKDINTAFEKKLDSLSNIPGNPIKSLEKSTKNLEFVLSFNEDTALYKEVEQMSTDNNKSIELAKILSGYVGPSYFDFKNRKVIFEKDLFNELYLVERDISALEWVLKKEKLVLNNLTCYKAITSITVEGRGGTEEIPITAWYTSDINISAGPDGFGGLPGLIIQLEKGNFVTTLKRIEFLDKKNKIDLPHKGKEILEDDFNELVKKSTTNRRKYK
ncbi:GLPGLI family protein [Winogradskyella vidalii]|uniref:GLPGLI family protein n=1 Tax=Winogradskyella vidalii TaxID=2615024 RepID=UPI0015CC6314|nr:GLPGLI family protein [Winogradskyella vidalii]